MPLECISIAVGIYFDIFGWSSNAARMQLERPDQDARMSRMHLECISIAVGIFRLPLEMRLECSWNFPTRMQECPECTSNASRLPSESFDWQLECGSNAVGTSRLGFKNAPMHLECISIAVGIYFNILVLKEPN